MAFAVIMPKAGMAMETGTIVHWLKQEGDPVAVGEPLLEIETDKVTMEVEAEAAGVLLRIIRGEGDEVPVTETIGYIGALGEEIPLAATTGSGDAGDTDSAESLSPAPGSPPPNVPSGQVRATPAARRLAGKSGIPLHSVSPTGRRGEITADDVRRAADDPAPGFRRPLTSMRRAIASAMTLSQQIPQFTIHAEANADRLSPGITSSVVRALALALRDAPEMAIVFDDDEIVNVSDPGIGIAVSVPGGIVVPVVYGAAELSVAEVDIQVRRLVADARGGTVEASDSGSRQVSAGAAGPAVVTTISNLGMYGVSHFAPMLTPRQSSALGVSTIKTVPGLADGALVERQLLGLALTVDHRIIDGAEAARFLQTVVRHVEATF